MDLFAPRHLLIILLVCLLVFGTKKLKTIGSDLGAAVRGFKSAMSDSETADKAPDSPNPNLLTASTAGAPQASAADDPSQSPAAQHTTTPGKT